MKTMRSELAAALVIGALALCAPTVAVAQEQQETNEEYDAQRLDLAAGAEAEARAAEAAIEAAIEADRLANEAAASSVAEMRALAHGLAGILIDVHKTPNPR